VVDVSWWLWLATIVVLLGVILADLFLVDHHPHQVTMREATRWVLFYLGLAVCFGLGVWLVAGGAPAGEFFAGYLTEYSLSIDNLFIFVIIMTAFRVPEEHQHRVLLVGVVIALAMRAVFIALGAAAIQRFNWVFYLFAVVLVVTAVRLLRDHGGDQEYRENGLLRLLRRVLPVTDDYHGAKLVTRTGGRRAVTPMLVVMLAIGSTDLLFALDSIPAVFGLTQEPYLVFTANVFALMGLRQLYFLIGGLLKKLVHLSYGLSVILGFIGVKLVLHWAHEDVDKRVPEISTYVSLTVIVSILVAVTVGSLLKTRRDPTAKAHPGALRAHRDGRAVTQDRTGELSGPTG
jgi:tellurite resistance protein TerC